MKRLLFIQILARDRALLKKGAAERQESKEPMISTSPEVGDFNTEPG